MLRRTKSLPIRIQFDGAAHARCSCRLKEFFYSFLPANLDRTQDIAWVAGAQLVSTFIESLNHPAPLLESVSIRIPGNQARGENVSLFNGSAPVLRELVMEGLNVSWDHLSSFSNLTCLRISNSELTRLEHILAALATFQELEVLELRRCLPPHSKATTSFPITALNNLKELKLQGSMNAVSNLLDYIRFPPTTSTTLNLGAITNHDKSRTNFEFLASHEFHCENLLEIELWPNACRFRAHGVLIDVASRTDSPLFLTILDAFAQSSGLQSLVMELHEPVNLSWQAVFARVPRFTSFKVTSQLTTEMMDALIAEPWPALQELHFGLKRPIDAEDGRLELFKEFLRSRFFGLEVTAGYVTARRREIQAVTLGLVDNFVC